MPDPVIVSTEVLASYRPWSGTVPSGYFAYFLGNLTRADYWAFSPEIRALYDRDRHESFTAPSNDDNIFDWLVMLEAVRDATGAFTMAALGAGWGRWLVAAAFACAQRGIACRLVGVEAEPTHFRWMLEHFADNGIDAGAHDLIEAAAAGRSGQSWFYVGRPDAWYGQALIHDAALAGRSGEIEYGGERARSVRTIDLAELTDRHPRIDYLHMDIQGSELEFLGSEPARLARSVGRVLVGTHSHEIEAGLVELFRGLGWRCQYNVPLNGAARVGDAVVTVGDGVQVWINPAW